MLRVDQRIVPVMELLDDINSGRLALPAFQRDFSWSEQNVRSLLATVLMGWPAGSLLIFDGRQSLVEPRSFEDGPPVDRNPELVLLDGQQRLTALFHALLDRGPYVFAIRASAFGRESVEELEDGIVAIKRTLWDKRYRQQPWDHELLVPFYSLRSSGAFFEFRDQVWTGVRLDLRPGQIEPIVEVYDRLLHRAHDFAFPVIEVETPSDKDDVARIFERVNRTGLVLNSFDLMVARVYEEDFNLRDRWDDARLQSSRLDRFLGDDGLPVLQVIALDQEADIRRSSVLDLDPRLIRERWHTTVDATDRALAALQKHCGVLDPSWLPYQGMLVPLAHLALEVNLDDHRDVLRRWFFSRSFAMTFEVAANTRLVSDDRLLRAASLGAKLPVDPARGDVLLTATRKSQGALWRAFMCALAANGADGLDGMRLDVEAGRDLGVYAADVRVASLLPRPQTGRTSLRERSDLWTLTQVLASRSLARQLTKSGVNALWPSLLSQAAEEEQTFASQFLPPRDELRRLADQPEQLSRERLRRLGVFLADVASQTVTWADPSDIPYRGADLSDRDRDRHREELLGELRAEYALSYGNSEALESERPLPVQWLRRRVVELGAKDLFPELEP